MEATHPCSCIVQAQEPYPEVQAAGRNRYYAEAMLSNLGGNDSEMTAVSRYFYDHLVTNQYPEVACVLLDISKVEMHHLDIFGTLARQLGADPRLWCSRRGRRYWWSPEYLQYTRKLGPLIQNAIRSERMTIQKYEQQLRWIRDANIADNLRRIIMDEQLHVEVLTGLAADYSSYAL